MRVIKFRVWSYKELKWVTDHETFYYNPGDKTINQVFNSRFLDTGIVFQQYTGLKDKNSKEIYEGDIIKQREFDGWFDDIGYTINHEIIFRESKNDHNFYVCGWSAGKFGVIYDTCEVIGNIFENPELLK